MASSQGASRRRGCLYCMYGWTVLHSDPGDACIASTVICTPYQSEPPFSLCAPRRPWLTPLRVGGMVGLVAESGTVLRSSTRTSGLGMLSILEVCSCLVLIHNAHCYGDLFWKPVCIGTLTLLWYLSNWKAVGPVWTQPVCHLAVPVGIAGKISLCWRIASRGRL